MKKMFVMFFMLMVVTLSASAQIIVGGNGNALRLDMNGDGIWDQEVCTRNVPGATYMKQGRNFYSELGRVYIVNQWRNYERMGVNPANYLPDPSSNADFSQYAGAYMPYVGGGMVGGAGYGMPGNVSVSVGGRNFGFGISVPVRNNGSMMYTPNASVGVNINGNYVGASVPVNLVKKNKKQRSTQTRTVQPQTRTRNMTVDEIQQMMNNDYM